MPDYLQTASFFVHVHKYSRLCVNFHASTFRVHISLTKLIVSHNLPPSTVTNQITCHLRDFHSAPECECTMDHRCYALFPNWKLSPAKPDKNTSLQILYTCIYFNTCLQNTIYLLKL